MKKPVIVEVLGYDRKLGATRVRARCACGIVFATVRNHVKSGHTRSCGCLSMDARQSPPPPSVRGARWVPLTRGEFALVDVRDFARVNAKRWWFKPPTATCKSGYAVSATRPRVSMHRFVLRGGAGELDHVDLDGLNNRRRNLRVATVTQNKANTARRIDNTSGHKGVVRFRGRWRAQIGNGVHLGVFDTFEAAVVAREAAARQRYGAFAREA